MMLHMRYDCLEPPTHSQYRHTVVTANYTACVWQMLQRQGNQVYWHIPECLAVALAGSGPPWDGAVLYVGSDQVLRLESGSDSHRNQHRVYARINCIPAC